MTFEVMWPLFGGPTVPLPPSPAQRGFTLVTASLWDSGVGEPLNPRTLTAPSVKDGAVVW